MQNKGSHIELGGKALSPSKYLQRAYPPAATAVVSTHRIAGKVSPSKCKVYTSHTTRQPSNLASENSFVELKDSAVSRGNGPTRPQSPLRDFSNLTVGSPRQLVRVNFVSNSPGCSRTSSTHAREFLPAAGKMMGVEAGRGEAERRVKVLEGRIGELHREKHEMAGRLNEENRKVYHENTALKLKLNELLRKADKQQGPAAVHRQLEQEAQALRAEVGKLQQIVQNLTAKNESLVKECQQMKAQLQESKQLCQQLQGQNNDLSQSLQKKEDEYDSLHCDFLQLSEQKLELTSMKEHYEQELQQIQISLSEAAQGNAQMVEEYECKLEEYRAAYDRNQEVIEQLSQQLHLAYAAAPPPPYPEEDEVVNRESEGELALECKNLESNFLQALEERDQQVQALERQNQELLVQLAGKEAEAEELSAHAEEQAGRLEEVAAVLERYTAKMQEMEGRYEQLRHRHQLEAQRTPPAPASPAEKCKKCEELTRTIFRLNSHLNKRA